MIRATMTRRVSKTGMQRTESANAAKPTPRASSFGAHLRDMVPRAKIAMRNPSIMVPPSPMNIFVFLPKTLCRKKGINAPATMTARDDHTCCPTAMKSDAKAMQAVMTNPDE